VDRLVVDCLDENRRTFRVFAEHIVRGPVLHEDHYTIDVEREARYTVAEWAIREAFAGNAVAGQSLSELERPVVTDALRTAKNNKSRAAALLGLTRSQLYTRLKRFDLE
jgi:transcriptional regulator with PAS, ATPase and Fis domain